MVKWRLDLCDVFSGSGVKSTQDQPHDIAENQVNQVQELLIVE